jgi:hypothetical protein
MVGTHEEGLDVEEGLLVPKELFVEKLTGEQFWYEKIKLEATTENPTPQRQNHILVNFVNFSFIPLLEQISKGNGTPLDKPKVGFLDHARRRSRILRGRGRGEWGNVHFLRLPWDKNSKRIHL